MPRSAYTIMISEEQRELLARALKELKDPCAIMFDPADCEELTTLQELFEDLPSADAECPPNTVHGFCL